MQRRFSYALTAGILSTGAPSSLPGLAIARPVLFALFGYILGRHADELAELAETDGLTCLLNPRGFSARLRSEIKRSKRYREPLSLLFLDLDGLKEINDRYGHRAGSDALRGVGRVIRAELRESDTGARWGGDEFAIIAPNTTNAAAAQFADRIRTRIAKHPAEWPMTASIGITTVDWNEDGIEADAQMLMREADAAMYEAKRRGKNTVAASARSRTDVSEMRRPEDIVFSRPSDPELHDHQ